jgi:hypothetical protein
MDEVVVGDGADGDGLAEADVVAATAAAAATVVWLRRCDMRSSLDENLRPQNSAPLIQLHTKGEGPPMEAAVELVDVVVGEEVEAGGAAMPGDGRPNRAEAVVAGG